MQYAHPLDDLKAEHARLYDRVGKNHRVLLAGTSHGGGQAVTDEIRLSEVEALVRALKFVARRVVSLDDFRWISDALLKWQVIVTNVLDEPINTDVPNMPRFLSPPSSLAGTCLTFHEVEHLVKSLAEARAAHRKTLTGRRSTPEEMKDDYSIAQAFFASDVISGKINFASRIGQDCYTILETTWLKDVKTVVAYLMWLDRVDDRLTSDPLDDYFRAVSHIRNLLTNPGIKAKREEFRIVQDYLDRRYIADGLLDYNARADARELVKMKAARIYDVTGHRNDLDNWTEAERYSKLFYENITRAAVDRDKESTLKVLKAFQFSKAPEHRYWIITAFEAILAIYFLNPDVVRQLWDESAKRQVPKPVTTSTVKVGSWPDEFEVPESCLSMFFYTGSEIMFRGAMSASQVEELSKGLNATQLDALRELFERSRLVHQETTL